MCKQQPPAGVSSLKDQNNQGLKCHVGFSASCNESEHDTWQQKIQVILHFMPKSVAGEEEGRGGGSSTVLRILTILHKLINKLNNLFCHTSNYKLVGNSTLEYRNNHTDKIPSILQGSGTLLFSSMSSQHMTTSTFRHYEYDHITYSSH